MANGLRAVRPTPDRRCLTAVSWGNLFEKQSWGKSWISYNSGGLEKIPEGILVRGDRKEKQRWRSTRRRYEGAQRLMWEFTEQDSEGHSCADRPGRWGGWGREWGGSGEMQVGNWALSPKPGGARTGVFRSLEQYFMKEGESMAQVCDWEEGERDWEAVLPKMSQVECARGRCDRRVIPGGMASGGGSILCYSCFGNALSPAES